MSNDYNIEHWTEGTTSFEGVQGDVISIAVNDRAAVREAIIHRIRAQGIRFIERSQWHADKNHLEKMQPDWNYTQIAIHHAGRSFLCGETGAFKMHQIQHLHMSDKNKFSDIGYHYAIDCQGNIYEGRDIRFKGEHLINYNTGVVGIVLLENLSHPDESNDKIGTLLKIINYFAPLTPSAPISQKKTLLTIIKTINNFFYVNTLGGHREFPEQNTKEGRLCPGRTGLKIVKELRRATGLKKPTGKP